MDLVTLVAALLGVAKERPMDGKTTRGPKTGYGYPKGDPRHESMGDKRHERKGPKG